MYSISNQTCEINLPHFTQQPKKNKRKKQRGRKKKFVQFQKRQSQQLTLQLLVDDPKSNSYATVKDQNTSKMNLQSLN